MTVLGPALFERLNGDQAVRNGGPVRFGAGGMSLDQIEGVEGRLGFPLPPDFRFLLWNTRDPGGVLFPWEAFSMDLYDEAIAQIRDGIAFDIEHNGVWLARWGEKPADLAAAKAVFREDFSTWPRLVPVLGHRFLAVDPCEAGNPVFSIMQTDIIYYGATLADYLIRELIPGEQLKPLARDIRRIPVWSDFAEGADGFLAGDDED